MYDSIFPNSFHQLYNSILLSLYFTFRDRHDRIQKCISSIVYDECYIFHSTSSVEKAASFSSVEKLLASRKFTAIFMANILTTDSHLFHHPKHSQLGPAVLSTEVDSFSFTSYFIGEEYVPFRELLTRNCYCGKKASQTDTSVISPILIYLVLMLKVICVAIWHPVEAFHGNPRLLHPWFQILRAASEPLGSCPGSILCRMKISVWGPTSRIYSALSQCAVFVESITSCNNLMKTLQSHRAVRPAIRKLPAD